ncbi:hypothetical protein [Pseudomonas phage D6]|nr:hypothetical protein [Pseudomonas phage D6]
MDLFLSILPYLELLFLLCIGHALADYPWQGEFVSQAKNRNTAVGKVYWKWVLPQHGLIHALPIYVVTGSVLLAFAEFICHTIIDFFSCEGKISFRTDQLLHLGCKVLWVVLLAMELPFLVE